MHDVIQQGLQTLASQNGVARDAVIVCAVTLLYLLGVSWLLIVVWRHARLTVATMARIVALGLLAYLAAKVLTHVIVDPRPYLVAHVRPLIPVAHDNGFPSDHTLLAAVLTVSLWWIDRRLMLPLALGTLLVMMGRLGSGAHHTIDVLGSVAIAGAAAVVVGALPLPVAWQGARLVRRPRHDTVPLR
jgi:membrane-associated phospholipid phosphatase